MAQAFPARLALRSPLAVAVDDEIRHSDEHRISDDEHDAAILPWLCALLAASDALDLSVEAQFTASVLLRRYQLLSGAFRVTGEARDREAATPMDPVDDGCSSEMFAVAACLFLACKAENEPRRLQDVVNCALQLRVEAPSHEKSDNNNNAGESNANQIDRVRVTLDPSPSGGDVGPASNDEALVCRRAKRGVLDAEQTILRWLGFDVQVSHPHRLLVLILQHLMASWLEGSNDQRVASRQSSMDRWRLAACQRLNTAIFSIGCLRHDIVSLSCASMALELQSVSASLTQASTNCSARGSDASYPGDVPLQGDWYLAVPGASKKAVAAARLDLERIAVALS